MAKVVLGIGAPQSPVLSIPPEHWGEFAERDKPKILYRPNGTQVTYAQLEEEAGDRFKGIVSTQSFIKISAAAQKAVQRIKDEVAKARPDLLVVIADDQLELFEENNMPLLSIYRGAELFRKPEALPASTPQWLQGLREATTIDPARHYPGAPDFANELIERLVAREFDVAAASEPTSPGKGIGHASSFVANRFVGEKRIPIVPLMVNVRWHPHVPSTARCYRLGQALRAAIEDSPRDLRVAILAVGGMSHLLSNETLDRQVLAAMQAGDVATLINLPKESLLGGSGQIKHWIVLAGALGEMKNQWVEYWPGYRTLGGTGTGLGFAAWS